MKHTPKIIKVSGPAVQAGNMFGCFMGEVVRAGKDKLIGEIIRIEGDTAIVQVYEDTIGLKAGDPVERTGELLSVELGPGLLGGIFDGIQRPLPGLAEHWGDFIHRGALIHRLDREKKWAFKPVVKPGDAVEYGFVIGTVQESEHILHKIMVPEGMKGVVKTVAEGDLAISDIVAVLQDGTEIKMRQRWNIREPRPRSERLPLMVPMITGQRAVDTLFPVAEGGAAIIPGGFGTGKTVLEQTIAKYAQADVIIYIGCGERGNEMADTLHQLTKLKDPHTGKLLLERTILIANTSNMPVAAREASIYTGVTIAEYYRDMGYRVAMLADSTSRWAEALREISSRLEEIPGEEGYPTYLASRIGTFYERAGRARIQGRDQETGSITVIGAVSPPGGDFSEPVTQASLRMASTFWELDYELAYQRHFPAINWRTSFSLAYPRMMAWYREKVGGEWPEMIGRTHAILQREEELSEVLKIVGADAMEDRERADLEAARLIREGYLRQSAVHPTDAYCSIKRQEKMLSLFLEYIDAMLKAVERGMSMDEIAKSPLVERLLRLKEISEESLGEEITDFRAGLKHFFESINR
ncbi:MAG: V-type ATP synthase subunit A [Nitrospinae bacterium]|nr:V-type ATP synthase subunit A [Nitrospinota bacterium]